MVSKNLFREDLYYRINTIVIEIPPLRDRGEDIVLLAEHFLKEYAVKYEKFYLKFSSKTLDKLMKYNWPGNVRELRHTIEKAVILCDSDILMPEDFINLTFNTTTIFRPKATYICRNRKTGPANCPEQQ